MSDVGKRVIWVGPADGSNSKPLVVEGLAVDASINPGMVLLLSTAGLNISDSTDDIWGQLPLIADKNQLQSGSVDDSWTQNENMVAIQPRSGEFLNVLVAASQTVTPRGRALGRDTSGHLVLTDLTNVNDDEIVAYSDEIVTTLSTATTGTLVRVRFA